MGMVVPVLEPGRGCARGPQLQSGPTNSWREDGCVLLPMLDADTVGQAQVQVCFCGEACVLHHPPVYMAASRTKLGRVEQGLGSGTVS